MVTKFWASNTPVFRNRAAIGTSNAEPNVPTSASVGALAGNRQGHPPPTPATDSSESRTPPRLPLRPRESESCSFDESEVKECIGEQRRSAAEEASYVARAIHGANGRAVDDSSVTLWRGASTGGGTGFSGISTVRPDPQPTTMATRPSMQKRQNSVINISSSPNSLAATLFLQS